LSGLSRRSLSRNKNIVYNSSLQESLLFNECTRLDIEDSDASVEMEDIEHEYLEPKQLLNETISLIPPDISVDEIYEALAIHGLNDLIELDDDDSLEDELGFSSASEHLKSESFKNPLYSNATINLGAALSILVTFSQKFKLSGAALSSLILLINLLLPADHIFPKSLYLFKKILGSLCPNVKTHYFCKVCMIKLCKDTEKCINPDCSQSKTPADKKIKKSFFMEFDIKSQIKSIFSRKGMLQKLHHRFSRSPSSHADIYDGYLYKLFSAPGSFLSYINNISFIWNTDGVPVFKSTKSSLWPVLYTINELPFHDRMKKENILISGLWYGECHPNMLTFLSPQMETLNDIKINGVEINDQVLIKGMVLCGTFDMPAKASVLNFLQFNAFYGCPKCLQEGETEKTDKGGNVRCFPFSPANPTGPCRTSSGTFDKAKKVISSSSKEPIYGVKGPSALMLLSDFDMIRGTSIDYMHCVLLGVTKNLLSLWFDPSHKNNSFSVYNKLDTAEKRILSLKPPNHITRAPRPIKGNLGYWKASEFRSFLLYYFVPVMINILPSLQFQHFYLLSHAIHLLLKTNTNDHDITCAKRYLFLFVYHFDKIYPRRYMTINIHSLIHLPETVEDLGPLYIYSLFHFEDKNGYILKLIHGTQNIPFQLASAVSASNFIPILCEENIESDSKEEEFIKKCNGEHHGQKFSISEGLAGIGSLTRFTPTDAEIKQFIDLFPVIYESAYRFPSVKVSGYIIRSNFSTKEYRRNSTTVFLKSQRYFSIDRFVCISDGEANYFVAFGNFFQLLPSFYLTEFDNCLQLAESEMSIVKRVKLSKDKEIIDVCEIVEQCVLLNVDNDNSFIVHFPNVLESD